MTYMSKKEKKKSKKKNYDQLKYETIKVRKANRSIFSEGWTAQHVKLAVKKKT